MSAIRGRLATLSVNHDQLRLRRIEADVEGQFRLLTSGRHDCQRQHFCLHYKMKRKPQIDADWPFVAWLAIVTGVAAMVTLIQTRPELLPLLLWSARQPM